MYFTRGASILIQNINLLELVNDGEIQLKFCRSEEQLADIFTNPLGKDVFEHLRQNLEIVNGKIINHRN